MHHMQKKAVVFKFTPLFHRGIGEKELKAAIKADREDITDEELDDIYKTIRLTPAPPPGAEGAETNTAVTGTEDEDEEDEVEDETLPEPAAPAKKKTPKAATTAPVAKAAALSKDVLTKLTGVLLMDKRKYPDGAPLPDILANPPVNEYGYVVCSEYKGEVKTREDKSVVWVKTIRMRANVKLTPDVLQNQNMACNEGHPYMYLPEIISAETLKAEKAAMDSIG